MILCKLVSIFALFCFFDFNSSESTTTIVDNDDKSGLKFRFTHNGVRYALDLGEKLVDEKLRTAKLPAVRLEIDAGSGKGQATIRKLIISDYKAPTYQYQPLSPTGLQWGATEGSITIKGIWSAWYKFLFKVSVDGYFIATVQNLTISAVLDIRKSADGRPEIKIPTCRTQVSAIRIKLTGGTLPKVMNYFRGALEEAIEGVIRKQVCQKVQNVLVEKANAKIKSLPPKIKIRNGPFLLDYTLTNDPSVTEDFFEAAIKGAITYGGEPSPVPAPSIPESLESSRMLYIWLSDYLPQSFLTSLHDQNLTRFEIDKEKMPTAARHLRTRCPGSSCVGTFKEEIAERYPNKYVAIDIQTVTAPTLTFGREKSELSIELQADMYIEPRLPENLIMTFIITMKAAVFPFFKSNNLTCNVTVENLDIQVNYTTVGEVSAFELYFVVEFGKPALQNLINQRIGPGFRIPTYDNIELLHPSIIPQNRVWQIETDFEYVPPEYHPQENEINK